MHDRPSHSATRLAFALLVVLPACSDWPTAPTDPSLSAARGRLDGNSTVQCDPDNGGITLPRGFCAVRGSLQSPQLDGVEFDRNHRPLRAVDEAESQPLVLID